MKRKEENEMSATPTRFRTHHSIPVARSFWEIEGGERDIWRSGMALPRDSALLLGAAKRLLRCNSPSRHRCGAYRLRMARLVVNVSDVNGAASPGCRRNAAAPPAERFYCAHVARSARRNPMKSIAAFSSDGSSERVVPNPSAIQRPRQQMDKFR